MLFIFSHHADKKEFIYGLTITFLLGCVVAPLLRSGFVPVLSVIVEKMKIPCITGFIFCYLAGEYIRKYEVSLPAPIILIVGILGTLTTSVIPVVLLNTPGGDVIREMLFSFFAPGVVLSSLAFFLLVMRLYRYASMRSGSGGGDEGRSIRKEAIRRGLHRFASCTMGVYLAHPLVLELWKLTDADHFLGNGVWSVPLRTLVVFLITSAFCVILGKIPMLRKLVS